MALPWAVAGLHGLLWDCNGRRWHRHERLWASLMKGYGGMVKVKGTHGGSATARQGQCLDNVMGLPMALPTPRDIFMSRHGTRG